MIFIETNRLLLKSWKDSDIDPFIKMNSDKEVMKFFPKTLDKEESLNLYNTIKEEISHNNFGLFSCEEKESNKFIGFIGLHKTTLPSVINGEFIEIGWRLNKDFWNKGLCTEGALACIHYGFYTLNIKEIYSFTSKLNLPSKRVMEKLGMNFVKDFNHPRVHETSPLYPHVLFKIKK